ncbi:hypothetical protein NFH98_12850 [Halomonas sp. H33-56]
MEVFSADFCGLFLGVLFFGALFVVVLFFGVLFVVEKGASSLAFGFDAAS